MPSSNPFGSRLRRKLLPVIDDPRRKFLSKIRQELTGGLGEVAQIRTKKPKTSRPGVRRGRPATSRQP